MALIAYARGMIGKLLDIFAKGVCDPARTRSAAEQTQSSALYRDFCAQVRRGVPPEMVRPQEMISIDKSRDLLRGTGIHQALNKERARYLETNPQARTVGDDFRDFRLTPLHSPPRINNPYLPPRPTLRS